MKITVRLPGGGWLRFEKKPMSEDAVGPLALAVVFLGILAFMLLLIWMLR